jgi:hypothetical protein
MSLEKLIIQKQTAYTNTWQNWLTCLFNPEKITLNKQVKWKYEEKPWTNFGSPSFSGGQQATIKFELVFDTTETSDDVRQYTDKLLELTLVEQTSLPMIKEPPLARFVWGKMMSFDGHIKKIQLEYLMFLPDGTPVRAKAKVDMEQRRDANKFFPQNPTSRSQARKMRTVMAEERLDLIAYQEYGDPAYWRLLAEANDINDPFNLRPGQILNIVPRA